MFSRYARSGASVCVVGVERRVERLPGDAAEADIGGVGEAAADPPLELDRFARAHERDDDRLLAVGLQLMRERDRLERAVREILDPHSSQRVVVEQAGSGRRVLLEPRLDGSRVGERVGAAAEAGVDQHPAPAGNVEAGIRPSVECGPRLGLLRADAPSPEAELGLGVDLRRREGRRGKVESVHLLQRAEHVPGQGADAGLVAEAARLGMAPPARDRLGDQLAAGDEVVERPLEHVGRRGAEADGRVADRHAALLEVVVLPRELVVVVADERARRSSRSSAG